MATLFVHTDTGECRLHIVCDGSVRNALDTTDLRVRAACGGIGSCGACIVRYLSGEVNAATLPEYQKLSASERAEGLRLACQLKLLGDAHIQLDNPARPSRWHSILPENLQPPLPGLPSLTEAIYGLAVDLGTTHIRVSLWDCKHGQRIASRCGPNPQDIHGSDVLNRLDAAHDRPARAVELAKLARAAIIQALRDMLARDVGDIKTMLAEIGRVVIVGNTAMLCLLTGCGITELLNPEHWQSRIDYQPADAAGWQAQWYLPNAALLLPPPVAGFVGSDLLADLIATGLCDGAAGAMLIDVGTNTEIALWDGQTLYITSVPGGPAFEGVGIRHGMAAEAGAIYSVAATENGITLDTIAGDEARGFCGSGLVDAIAVLLACGILKPSGRFAQSAGSEGYRLAPNNPRTALTGHDVDAFQRAKASIAAAMAQLLALAGMDWLSVQRLCICGAFGRHLSIAHAQAVGLLPPLPAHVFELNADAALAGCEQALLCAEPLNRFDTLCQFARTINMSYLPAYEDRYINHLSLRPISTGALL